MIFPDPSVVTVPLQETNKVAKIPSWSARRNLNRHIGSKGTVGKEREVLEGSDIRSCPRYRTKSEDKTPQKCCDEGIAVEGAHV